MAATPWTKSQINAPLTATEWLQKALFYTIELVARLIAANVKDHVEELTVDLFSEQSTPSKPVDTRVRVIAKPVFAELIKIGTSKLYSKTSEEYSALENIKQCLRIFDYVEDEIEKIAKHASYMRSPIHDMLIDRRPLDEGFGILKNISVFFEETYFESALESGNIETVKSVCLRLAADQKRLREIASTLEADKISRLPIFYFIARIRSSSNLT
uniref:Conserved oligomeric Golgi complex subunit 3 n=1 Tax=Panagrellus redivivus TaxID=6233 RepID=A0A7E5A0C2_PANRE